MADRIIQTADLSTIGKNLEVLSDGIRVVHEDVVTTNKHVMNVDSNVRVVYDEVEKLKGEFLKYVDAQLKANRLQQARTTIISIRQELEKNTDITMKFGAAVSEFYRRPTLIWSEKEQFLQFLKIYW
ncbi:hypothetical protein [Allobaculum sp. Allo2]|uniref:hypothetical protein n=1 Tax=Allobaculum sp. Allo2 TaxID=2853432 RepID=UPI001F62256E|nr:hypothetical protein [Allobaculum sp. Allo2]UNT93698.1 hypothetical protein KWG61_02805 [Allobaculum sp. Allo2]